MTKADMRPLSLGMNIRLSTMMFLQYAIWGAWLPFLWSFLAGHRGMSPAEIGNMFAVGAVGAIVGPFIVGQIADRHMATQKVLGVSHLIGALLIWQLAWVDSYTGFLIFSGLYGLVYTPTMSLTNSLAFHHLPDRDRDFGRVRLWGTFGWIVVGLAMGQWLALQHTPSEGSAELILAQQAAGKADAFRLSAILGAFMGLFCFSLPDTPPVKDEKKNAALQAMGSIKRQPLLTLFLLAVPISCIHHFYFVHTDSFLSAKNLAAPDWVSAVFGAGGGGLMTVGQMSEVLVLALLPTISKRFSRKALLATGILAYAARMALFAYVDVIALPSMVTLLLGIALHGVCFGAFIFVAFMIVDEETSFEVRASAQSLFNLVIVGVGVILGSKLAAWVAEYASSESGIDYGKLFRAPMWGSLACLLALLLFYPSHSRSSVDSPLAQPD